MKQHRLTAWVLSVCAWLRRLICSRHLRRLGVTLALVVLLGVVDYERYLSGSDLPLDAYPLLSLSEHRRLLVLAPHCDDETLGAAGLIQAALRIGIQVQVVIATNGDGYLFATMEEFRQAFPRPQDFINMGERRREESLSAMSVLGLSSDAVIFLGYPDRGLSAMWWSNWENERPYRSPYSQRDHNPYTHTRQPGAPYSGQSLLRDLIGILSEFQPDLIVLPHPLDEHPDHRALSAFTFLAVELTHADNPDYDPTLLGYLVHYGMYPQHRRLAPLDGLRPPRQLQRVGEWVQWMLLSGDMTAKQRAVGTYKSQLRLLGAFLRRFVQPNELFMRVESATVLEAVGIEVIPYAKNAAVSLENLGSALAHDPVRDSAVRTVSGGADIAGLHVLRWGDDIWVTLELRASVSQAYTYYLNVRTFWEENSTTWQLHLTRAETDTAWAKGKQVWFKLDRKLLGDPAWLAVAAETRQRGILLDRTAWHLIRLHDWPWKVDVPDERP